MELGFKTWQCGGPVARAAPLWSLVVPCRLGLRLGLLSVRACASLCTVLASCQWPGYMLSLDWTGMDQ